MTSQPDPPLDSATQERLADELRRSVPAPTAAQRHARSAFRDEENLALEQVTAEVRQALATGQPCIILVPTDGQERLARPSSSAWPPARPASATASTRTCPRPCPNRQPGPQLLELIRGRCARKRHRCCPPDVDPEGRPQPTVTGLRGIQLTGLPQLRALRWGRSGPGELNP